MKKQSFKVSKNVSLSNPNTFKTFSQKVQNFPSETLLTKSPSDQITKSILSVLILSKNIPKESNRWVKTSTKFWFWKKKSSN